MFFLPVSLRTPLVVSFLLAALALLVGASPGFAAPAFPGVARLLVPAPHLSDKDRLARQTLAGQILTAELRCARCHAGMFAQVPAAPPLADVSARVSANYLRAFLLSPVALKPGTAMPDVLSSVPATERGQVADELVAFLQTRGGALQTDEQWGDFIERDNGEKLFAQVGCVACHGSATPLAPTADHTDETFVPLGALARKTTVSQLVRFLLNPAEVRPGTRMPNFRLTAQEAGALATYLLRDQLPRGEAEAKRLRRAGVRYEYFEGFVREGPPDWGKMKLVRRGIEPSLILPDKIRDTKIALRYTTLIDVKVAGSYKFFAESNDGSELSVDGNMVVKNHGFHGKKEVFGTLALAAGMHALDVSFWQDEGSKALNIAWHGPEFSKQRRPAGVLFAPGSLPMKPVGFVSVAPNAAEAAKGARHFVNLGCAGCHENAAPAAAPLAALNLNKGCLGDKTTSDGTKSPRFNLDEMQRNAIASFLQSSRVKKTARTDAKAATLSHLATHNCVACHERDGLGGPWPSVKAAFAQTVEVDLGEEGRLPPSLTDGGQKLRVEAVRRIVGQGELHVRPYMATRMPSFSDLIALDVAKIMSVADRGDASVPKAGNKKAFEDGRRLLGVSSNPALTGFGCINCHSVADHAGPGSPGPDLSLVTARLNYRWFDKWLAAPQSLRPNTRMPAFWGDEPLLPDVAGGVPRRQRAAIWAYLQRGATPLPEGVLVEGAAQELVVRKEPIVYRTFMKDGGPRAIVVGNPELVHVAFDANVVRMAQAWRGRFWDPSGTWTGRGGSFNEPLGDHILAFPAGPSFARLPQQSSPWPSADLLTRELGGRFLGYRLDEHRRPAFRYSLEGVTISEVARPLVGAHGFGLVRAFTFDKSLYGYTLLAGEGKRIEKASGGRYVIDGHVFIKMPAVLFNASTVRTAPNDAFLQQILIAVPQAARAIDLEVFWQ